jgi:hypothetical protein
MQMLPKIQKVKPYPSNKNSKQKPEAASQQLSQPVNISQKPIPSTKKSKDMPTEVNQETNEIEFDKEYVYT